MQHLQKTRGEAVVMVNQNSGSNSATKGLIELARQPDIRPYRGKRPQIAASAYIDPAAVIIGDVVIGEDSSVWPCSVVRGAVHNIRIPGRPHIEYVSICHVMRDGYSLTLGDVV